MKNQFDGKGRPDAPANATVAEKQEWSAIVNSFPDGWFNETDLQTILELARARVTSNALASNIENNDLLDDVKKLMAMRDRECRRAVWLLAWLKKPKTAAT
jgi:hypothetical protein